MTQIHRDGGTLGDKKLTYTPASPFLQQLRDRITLEETAPEQLVLPFLT